MKQKILAEIERLRNFYELSEDKEHAQYEYDVKCGCDMALDDILSFINSLPEEPKFKVGDMVASTKNHHLTYKILQVGLQNELGKLDYEAEIFTNGKAGIKIGDSFKEHNIHLISCEKMDEWGELLPKEPVSEDLEEAADNYATTPSINNPPFAPIEFVRETFKAGAQWQSKKDSRKYAHVPLKDVHDAWQTMIKNNPSIKEMPAVCFLRGADWQKEQIINKE